MITFLKERANRWRIEWNKFLFHVVVNFLDDVLRLHVILPYADWHIFALQFERVAHDRVHQRGQALKAIGMSGPIYQKKDSVITVKPLQDMTSLEKSELLKKITGFSEEDLKTGLKSLVQVMFSREGIHTSVTLSREDYLQFETDIIEAQKKLKELLGKAV